MRCPQLLNPHETARELIDLNQKVLKGIESLARIRDEDFQVGWNKRSVSMQPSSFSVSICR